MRAVWHNDTAGLQVGLLKIAVMLVGKTYFIGFVPSFIANFTNAGHSP
jgi:hypothetical protein